MEDNRLKKLSYEERIKEYINLLNNGYIPKSNDKETTFSDGTIIGQFWRYAKDKIKEKLEKEKYLVGYDLAKEVVNNTLEKMSYEERIKEYIDLLNNGYIPKSIDKKTTFKDGTTIDQFWRYTKEKIKEELQKEEYLIGYELAREIVNDALKKISHEERIKEYINLLNKGYIPKKDDKKTRFTDGTIIGQFWNDNKEKLKEELKKDEYNIGYDLAKKILNDTIKKIRYKERLEEYINLLNNGYIPKSNDKEVAFTDGTIIGQFWRYAKEKIKEELEKDKYAIGYDLAKKIVNDKLKKLSYEERIKEFITLLNNGYIPKRNNKEVTFSDGTTIDQFFTNNIERLKEELKKDEYNAGYDLAKKIVNYKSSNNINKSIDLETKTFDELLQILNGKSSWIDIRYKENIEDILTFLNLDSESIIRDMNINIITLKNAIKKEVCKKNIKKEYDFLKEFYYKLINEISINPSEEEISNIFITLIRKLSLEKEEIEVLKKAFISYIKVMKDYYKLDVALTDNFEIKCKKIKKYHLTTEEILDSYYISFEFYNKKLMDRHSEEYYRWQLLRQYMIDWDYYTLEEKEKIRKNFSSEEISILTKRNEEINVLIKKYKKE